MQFLHAGVVQVPLEFGWESHQTGGALFVQMQSSAAR